MMEWGRELCRCDAAEGVLWRCDGAGGVLWRCDVESRDCSDMRVAVDRSVVVAVHVVVERRGGIERREMADGRDGFEDCVGVALMRVKTDWRVVTYGCVNLRVFDFETTFADLFCIAFVDIEGRGGRPGVRDELCACVNIEPL